MSNSGFCDLVEFQTLHCDEHADRQTLIYTLRDIHVHVHVLALKLVLYIAQANTFVSGDTYFSILGPDISASGHIHSTRQRCVSFIPHPSEWGC